MSTDGKTDSWIERCQQSFSPQNVKPQIVWRRFHKSLYTNAAVIVSFLLTLLMSFPIGIVWTHTLMLQVSKQLLLQVSACPLMINSSYYPANVDGGSRLSLSYKQFSEFKTSNSQEIFINFYIPKKQKQT